MSLRTKTVLIVLAVFSVHMLIGVLVENHLVYPRFESIELDRTEYRLEQCRASARNLADEYGKLVAQCARWPRLREVLLTGRMPQDLAAHFSSPQLNQGVLNMVSIVDRDGRILYGAASAPDDEAPAFVSPFTDTQWPTDHPFSILAREAGTRAGYLDTELDPVLIGASSITDPADGSPLGFLVAGQYLTEDTLDQVNRQIGVDLELWYEPATYSEAEMAQLLERLGPDRLDVRHADSHWLDCVVALLDIHDVPIIFARTRIPRTISAQGRDVRRLTLMVMALGGLALMLAGLLGVDKIVLSRVELYASRVDDVAATKDLSLRLPVRGEDELAGLGREINHMLVRLEEADIERTEREASEEDFRQRLTRLHEVNNTLSQALTFEQLCRQAVTLGRERLGFKRVSIWTTADDAAFVRGTFGTSPEGETVDEGALLFSTQDLDGDIPEVLSGRANYASSSAAQINETEHFGVIGAAPRAVAGLWDGQKVIGFVSIDTFPSGDEITDQDREVLLLFASAVGRLLTQKRAEEALRASEAGYRGLFENAAMGICVFRRADSVIQEVNPAMARILGCDSADQLRGRVTTDFFVDPAESERILAALAHRGVVPHFQIQMKKRDGHVVWGEGSAWQGSREGTTEAVLMDVTDRIEAEKALRQSEATLQSIFRATPVGIMMLEGQQIRWTNLQFREMTGYSEMELRSQNTQALYPSIDEFGRSRQALLAPVSETGIGEVEATMVRKDGSPLHCLIRATHCLLPGAAGSDNAVICAVMDLSERRQLEEQLRQAQKMEAVGQLAGGIAHDFNNLLQAIQGYTEMALVEAGEIPDLVEYLEQVRRASRRAAQLVRQLLAFSRRQPMRPELLDLNVAIGGLVKMLRRLIGEHIELAVIPGANLWTVNADPGQVEQVLVNLCVNARDAMPEGGRIEIQTANVDIDRRFAETTPGAQPGHYVRVSVRDSGAGIPAEDKERIFEPFYTTKEVGKGTGLGLSTVYGITQQHGGLVDVQDAPGGGATFNVYLPALQHATASEEQSPPQCAFAEMGGSETILLAEDEQLVRDLALSVLKKAGYRVLVAQDGEEAVEVFRDNADEVALAVLDMVMPRKNGRAAYEEMVAIKPGLGVVFSSGYSFTPDEKIDAASMLPKPYQATELLARVREALDAAAVRDARPDSSA